MRYLYGDSDPFPPQYDFLAALDVFCAQAARIVRLEAEARAFRVAAQEAATLRGRAVDDLEAFHREAVGALVDGARDSAQAAVTEYVRQLGDLATRIVALSRQSAVETSERELRAAIAEGTTRSVEVRDALEKLLIAVRLPVTESRVTMTLSGTTNEFAGMFAHKGGLVASFALGTKDLAEWQGPRHVRDFAQDVSLPVGIRRSLFKRTIAPETISLDEYILGGFELRDDQADLRLRKKPEQPDSLLFTIRRIEDRVRAEAHHPDDAEADDGLPPLLDDTSAAEVERLWQLLRKASLPVMQNKKRIVTLELAGSDVFASGDGTKVVALIVDAIAAITTEVQRRSPNKEELSLKLENDAGRREEIYLRTENLRAALATVPAPERAVFDALGLAPTVIVS